MRLRFLNFRLTSTPVPLVISAAIAASFAFRAGVPGFHHDWIWPVSNAQFLAKALGGLSTWNAFGFGADLDAPAVNYVTLLWWLLSSVGIPAPGVLVLFVTLLFVAGQWGFMFACSRFGFTLPWFARHCYAFAYAFSPVAFQKFAAGHLYFMVAYELLPLFSGLFWSALMETTSSWRSASYAGLTLAVMDAQIQFFGFCLLIAAIFIVLTKVQLASAVRCLLIVAAIALINIFPLFLNLGGGEVSSLLWVHPNHVWEVDLSGHALGLLGFGGYLGYDTAALPAALVLPYRALCYLVCASALGGVAYAFLRRRFRRIAAAAFAVGAFAVIWAEGMNGPLASAFDYALHHTPLFTIVREFYHVMALYAFGCVTLAALGASLSKRWISVALASAALGVTLPFLILGENRLVPAVPASLASDPACDNAVNLCLLLPYTPPVGWRNEPRIYGIDPALLISNSANAGAPPFVYYALAAFTNGDPRLLTALGIGGIDDRPTLESRAPELFEPHVGADFSAFLRMEHRLVTSTYGTSLHFPVHTMVYLEQRGARNVLDTLPDATLPPGVPAIFTSSFDNNGIKTSWVLGSMWAPQFPQLMGMSSPELVLTESTSPLGLAVPHGVRGWLYVLAHSMNPTLDGARPARTVLVSRSEYAWYVWPITFADRPLEFRSRGISAVARAIVSERSGWSPPREEAEATGSATNISGYWRRPWTIVGSLPTARADNRFDLIFARSYSRRWRLIVDGHDLGAPKRAHAFFNGWALHRGLMGKPFVIVRAGQEEADVCNAAAIILSITLLFVVMFARRPKSPNVPAS